VSKVSAAARTMPAREGRAICRASGRRCRSTSMARESSPDGGRTEAELPQQPRDRRGRLPPLEPAGPREWRSLGGDCVVWLRPSEEKPFGGACRWSAAARRRCRRPANRLRFTFAKSPRRRRAVFFTMNAIREARTHPSSSLREPAVVGRRSRTCHSLSLSTIGIRVERAADFSRLALGPSSALAVLERFRIITMTVF